MISGHSVWTARDLSNLGSWSVELTRPEAAEVVALVAGLKAKGKTLDGVQRKDFARPPCDRLAADIYRQLVGGVGFALLRGVPVKRLGLRGSAMFFWGLGSLLGRPLPQNAEGARLYHVEDLRTRGKLVLSSKTNGPLPWHTDSGSGAFAGAVPDLLGLMAIRTAPRGGTSHILSAHTVHNRLLRRYPRQLARLYQRYYFDRTLQMQPGEDPFVSTPIFERVNGVVCVRYNRQRVERGHQMAGVALGPSDQKALDRMDEVLNDPELSLELDMEPGDALFSNNWVTLHNRTAFIDGDTPQQTRLLYRLWIQMAQAQ